MEWAFSSVERGQRLLYDVALTLEKTVSSGIHRNNKSTQSTKSCTSSSLSSSSLLPLHILSLRQDCIIISTCHFQRLDGKWYPSSSSSSSLSSSLSIPSSSIYHTNAMQKTWSSSCHMAWKFAMAFDRFKDTTTTIDNCVQELFQTKLNEFHFHVGSALDFIASLQQTNITYKQYLEYSAYRALHVSCPPSPPSSSLDCSCGDTTTTTTVLPHERRYTCQDSTCIFSYFPFQHYHGRNHCWTIMDDASSTTKRSSCCTNLDMDTKLLALCFLSIKMLLFVTRYTTNSSTLVWFGIIIFGIGLYSNIGVYY